jgi:hypothetical protein
LRLQATARRDEKEHADKKTSTAIYATQMAYQIGSPSHSH